MQFKIFLFFLLFVLSQQMYSQTGIGTRDVDSSALLQLESTDKTFVLPRLNDAQMLLVPSPLIGAQIYNTTYQSIFIYTSIGWRNINSSSLASLMIDRDFPSGNSISTVNDTYYLLPIGISNIKYNTEGIFEVEANATIRIKKQGTYIISSGLSVTNMPAGNKKYALKVYNNSNLLSILNAGEVSMPGVDFWGVNGAVVAVLNENDLITIKYMINNNGGLLTPKFCNISITQL